MGNCNEIFYVAISPRQLGSDPEHIIETTFNSYNDAIEYLKDYRYDSYGVSVFIKRNNKWVEVTEKDNKYFIHSVYDVKTGKELFDRMWPKELKTKDPIEIVFGQ